jgi:hypothetical protein
MLSTVPTAGECKWTVLFNAVDTSERLVRFLDDQQARRNYMNPLTIINGLVGPLGEPDQEH